MTKKKQILKNVLLLMFSVLFTIIFSVVTYNFWSEGKLFEMIVPLFLVALGTIGTARYTMLLSKTK